MILKIGRSLIILSVLLPAVRTLGLESKSVIGEYELQGVMETAGRLRLEKNNRYLAGFSYGAGDWVEEGTWKLEGEEVVLSDSRIKAKNHSSIALLLPAGIRFHYQDGKLSSVAADRRLTFLNPNKTPSPVDADKSACAPAPRAPVPIAEGSLLRVESDQVVINDVLNRQDVAVKRSWAEKKFPALLQPPKLYQRVGRLEVPIAEVICVKPVTSGEGRMRVRGRIVQLDSESFLVEMGECFTFSTAGLSESALQSVKNKKEVDVEIPYSAMLSSGGCP